MARDLDGASKIEFGSDASLDGFTALTVACWVKRDVTGGTGCIATKGVFNDGWEIYLAGASNGLGFQAAWSTSRGIWDETTPSLGTGLHHVAATYDASSLANDPTLYVDGVAVAITENLTPVGTFNSDAAYELQIGDEGSDTGAEWFDGKIAHLVYDNRVWSAAEVNRHRWWGVAPGGSSSVKVWHPLWTPALQNKGTAVATGTATGTTMDNASVPKVERAWGSMMGCGR